MVAPPLIVLLSNEKGYADSMIMLALATLMILNQILPCGALQLLTHSEYSLSATAEVAGQW